MKRALALITALSLVLFFSPFPASAACNIAYDSSEMTVPNTATSPVAFSHTSAGSDIGMLVGVTTINDVITSISFNGVSGTLVRKDLDITISNFYSQTWFLPNVGAAAGTVSIVFTTGGTNKIITAGSATYTCISHSASVDGNNWSHGTTGTSHTNAVTSAADNAWHVAAYFGDNSGISGAGAGTTQRSLTGDTSSGWFDNNAVIHPAGSNTLTINSSINDDTRIQGVTLAPFIAAAVVPSIIQPWAIWW